MTSASGQDMLLETLVLREQGRKASLRMKRLFLGFYLSRDDEKATRSAVDLLKDVEELEKPWLAAADPDAGKSAADRMFDYYNQVMANGGQQAKDTKVG